ncbi:MAG: hypothetical protein HY231_19915 [Acidobacteria bacterium]|nr:hypothetical protein [Acidobacteriota bacterium]
MKSKYGKPKQFSDPYKEHGECQEELKKILDKEDRRLTLEDFSYIFSIALPAADYQEGVYYIPLCFEQMMKKEDPINSNICQGIFWYLTHFKKELEADYYYRDCMQMIRVLSHCYTQDFELIRLSEEELDAHSIDPRYREMAKHSSSVHDLIDVLIRYSEYEEILFNWVDSLDNKSLVANCWWINIGYHVRWWQILYHENDKSNERKEKLIHRLHKFGDYQARWWEASSFAASKKFYEYNRRVSLI